MKALEVNIELDPVNDGASIINIKEVKEKRLRALIISTDGQRRIASFYEVGEIFSKLSGTSHGEFMGKTPYMMIINADKIIKLETGYYFIGSAIIMKDEGNGKRLEYLTDEDIEKAEAEFKSRLVTLTAYGQEFSAYELI